jgi:nicotinic acid phosphoribosyltransferase
MNLRDKAGNNVFSEGFLNYLQRFRYAGMLWTMPEETLVFENQPILQIKGNAIQVAILQLWVQHLIRPAGKMEESTQQIQVRRFYNSDLQQIQDIIFSPDSEPIVNFEATSWQDLLQLKTYKVSETL